MEERFIQICKKAVALEQSVARRVSKQLSDAIRNGEQDLRTLDHLIDPLWDSIHGLSASGIRTYQRYMSYVETFAPEEAKKLREDFEDSMGYKLLAVYVAADIARQWHAGQTDKAGKDYFTGHLSNVSRDCYGWKAKVVGFLHDTAEDTPHTVDEIICTLKSRLSEIRKDTQLKQALIERHESIIDLFPSEVFHPLTQAEYEEIAEALHLLNHHTAPNRAAYIERFRGHGLALRVKMADMRHNMDLSRIPQLTPKDLSRQARYQKEYDQLTSMMNELYPLPPEYQTEGA